jgi:predicted methyltransferase
VPHYSGPLLTRPVAESLCAARDAGADEWQGSLTLGLTRDHARLSPQAWQWRGQHHPYPGKLKDRTIYYRDGDDYAPVARFSGSLIKLVPTEWGAPTFEIDGIKMLPTAKTSPVEDAQRKVALVEPAGKAVLDTCGGLGYFAACCLEAGVTRIHSFEKNADVLWLRTLNPWSPDPDADASGGRLLLAHADVSQAITSFADARSTPHCTIHRASVSRVSSIHKRSMTSSPACCAVAVACSTTPAARTGSPAVATCRAKWKSGWRRPASRRNWRWMACWRCGAESGKQRDIAAFRSIGGRRSESVKKTTSCGFLLSRVRYMPGRAHANQSLA